MTNPHFVQMGELDLFKIDIDPQYTDARARELERQRQPHVTKTDNCDFQFFNDVPAKLERASSAAPIPKEKRIAWRTSTQYSHLRLRERHHYNATNG